MIKQLFHRIAVASLSIVSALAAVSAFAVDLPANYTRLDWIESDKTAKQWIDSGYHPKSNTVIRASILERTRSENWAFFFGVMKDDSPRKASFRSRSPAESRRLVPTRLEPSVLSLRQESRAGLVRSSLLTASTRSECASATAC